MKGCSAHLALIVAFLAALTGVVVAAPEKRVALVIGNNEYQNFVALSNPANDAENLKKALESINFDVAFYKDTTLRGFLRAIQEFNKRAKDADVALVYYAGHAVQFNGKNYLLQVDDEAETLDDISIGSVPVEKVLEVLSAGKGIKILILDACRNNPAKPNTSPTASRSISQELARDVGLARPQDYDISGKGGMVIAYATLASHVAEDGQGANSPYNVALVNWITAVDLTIPDIFTNVTGDVVRATNERQHPIYDSSLTGKYILNPTGSEWVDWANVKDSTDVDKLMRFLDAHPDSAHAPQVRQKLEILQQNLAEAEWDRLKDSGDLAAWKAFRNRYPRSPRAADAASNIAALEQKAEDEAREMQAWEQAKAANNIGTLRAFLSAYPNSAHRAEAERQIEAETAWERVRDRLDITTLQQFRTTYPGSAHDAEAAQKIAVLQKAQDDRQRESAEWARVRDSDDVAALQDFLDRHARSSFAGEAQSKLVEAQQKAEAQRGEKAWDQVKNSLDIPKLERFMLAYPDSPHGAEADQQIALAREKAENERGEKEWEPLKNSSDVDALQGYLARFPHSPHVDEAKQIIAGVNLRRGHELDQEMAWDHAKRSNSIDELNAFKHFYADSPHGAQADEMIAALTDKKRQDEEQQRKQAEESDRAKEAEARCKQEATDVEELVKARSIDALLAEKKQAGCPKTIAAIEGAIKDIQAQDCRTARERVQTINDLATLRGELGALACPEAEADARAKIAALETEAKRAQDEAARKAKACAEAKSGEDKIDPSEPGARDAFAKYQKSADCPDVAEAAQEKVNEIDGRVSSAHILLAKFGCYTVKPASDRFDVPTQEAIGKFLSASHLPGAKDRLTQDLVDEMQSYNTDTGVCPAPLPPAVRQPPVASLPPPAAPVTPPTIREKPREQPPRKEVRPPPVERKPPPAAEPAPKVVPHKPPPAIQQAAPARPPSGGGSPQIFIPN